jgi:hypothetical protein
VGVEEGNSLVVLDVMVPEVMESEMEALELIDELTESVVLADGIFELELLLSDTVDKVVELLLLMEERLKLLEEEKLRALLDDEMPVLLVGNGGSQLVEEELITLLDADGEFDLLDKDNEVSKALDDEESSVLLNVEERLKVLVDEVTVALLSVIERLLLLEEDDMIALLESEELPMLLDGDGASVVPLENDVVLMEDAVPLLLELEMMSVPLEVPNVLELLKLELVEAVLDELVVSVLLTDEKEIIALLEDELLISLLLGEEVVAELLNTVLLLVLDSVGVGHGGLVTSVFVNVDVTNSVDVFLALASPSLLGVIHTVLIDVIDAVVSPNSDLHKHALL